MINVLINKGSKIPIAFLTYVLRDDGNNSNRIKKNKKPVKPRYLDPSEPTNTWNRRGRQPRWLATKIAEGAKLQDFLIKG